MREATDCELREIVESDNYKGGKPQGAPCMTLLALSSLTR